MKAYLMTTGAVFGLITLAHLWRILDEWPHLATEPGYLLITVAAAALCLWAWRLLRRLPQTR
jgi:protein-S-isoprenylcysteine O-methyltransferase Ste14